VYEYRAKIASVYDGDTLRADIDLGFGTWIARQNIRLYGIDAPELGTPDGLAARDWLRNLLPVGTDIVLITYKDKGDKYGRYLGDIYLPPDLVTSLNQKLIDAGHARPYDGGAR
jgi:micrococcal nuclease